MNAVPIPPGAIASQNCKDEYMTVYQPSSDQLWDLWHLHKLADGSWGADWGGHMTNVSQNPGHFDARWGVTATSLPLMGGLIRLSDLQQGHIDHALAFAHPLRKAERLLVPGAAHRRARHRPVVAPRGRPPAPGPVGQRRRAQPVAAGPHGRPGAADLR